MRACFRLVPFVWNVTTPGQKKANEHTRRHSLHTSIKHIQRYHNINWINQIFSTITNVLRTKLSYRYNTSYLPLPFFLFYPLAHSPCRDGPGVDHVVHRPADGTRIRAATGSASSASCEPEPFPPRSLSSARRISCFFARSYMAMLAKVSDKSPGGVQAECRTIRIPLFVSEVSFVVTPRARNTLVRNDVSSIFSGGEHMFLCHGK